MTAKRSRVDLATFALLAEREFGTLDIKRKQAFLLRDKYAILVPSVLWDNKVGAGLFRVDADPAEGDSGTYPEYVAPAMSNGTGAPVNAAGTSLAATTEFNGVKVFSTPADHSLVPDRDPNFVAWGHFSVIKKLLSDNRYVSIYLVGETGNGKTFNFEQAAAQLGREIIILPFTAETDEDDLVGGFRLVNGETVWVDGPVIEAMRRGAILVLDEVDQALEPVMTLQSVLQGKPYFIKKLGRQIKPAPGFKVVATANTRGDGEGDYAFTNVMNKAFLDRFKVTLTQDYPTASIEKKILTRFMENNCAAVNESFANDAVKWANMIREAYKANAIQDQVSTRRLVDMTLLFDMLGDTKQAVELATNRFREDVREAMMRLWETVDTAPDPEEVEDEAEAEYVAPDEVVDAPWMT